MHQLGNNFFLGCSRHHLHYAKDCNLFQSAILALWGKIKCRICTLNYVRLGVPVPFDMQFSVPTVSPLCGPTPQNFHGKLWKSNHCKWLSPQRIFPNPRKKPPSSTLKAASHSSRYVFRTIPVQCSCDTRLFDLRIQFCVRISHDVVNYLGSCHIFNLGTCNMLLGYCGCNIL